MNTHYEQLVNPKVLHSKIENFDEWLDLGTQEDLKACLKAYEDAEMYEQCIIIKNKIL